VARTDVIALEVGAEIRSPLETLVGNDVNCEIRETVLFQVENENIPMNPYRHNDK
jgi:hypothetical protein